MNDKVEGLPVPGYVAQTQEAIDAVTRNKELEERCLRTIEDLAATNADPRWLAIGRSHIEQAWMAINRAVFKPKRVRLPEDPT